MKRATTFSLLAAATLVCGVQSASAQTLVLRYDFDHNDGGDDVIDTGSFPLANGAFQGAATRTTNTPLNQSAGALDLTSATAADFVDAGDADKVTDLTSFTLTGWINVQGDDLGNDRIMSKLTPSFNSGYDWILASVNGVRQPDAFGMSMFIGGETGAVFVASTDTLDADNKWAFVAVTYDGTATADNLTFYTGGETTGVSQLGDVLTANAGAPVDNDAKFRIAGTDGAPTANLTIPGFLDDLRIYDGVLSPADLDTVRVSNLPEPASLALLGLGGLAVLGRRRG